MLDDHFDVCPRLERDAHWDDRVPELPHTMSRSGTCNARQYVSVFSGLVAEMFCSGTTQEHCHCHQLSSSSAQGGGAGAVQQYSDHNFASVQHSSSGHGQSSARIVFADECGRKRSASGAPGINRRER